MSLNGPLTGAIRVNIFNFSGSLTIGNPSEDVLLEASPVDLPSFSVLGVSELQADNVILETTNVESSTVPNFFSFFLSSDHVVFTLLRKRFLRVDLIINKDVILLIQHI